MHARFPEAIAQGLRQSCVSGMKTKYFRFLAEQKKKRENAKIREKRDMTQKRDMMQKKERKRKKKN